MCVRVACRAAGSIFGGLNELDIFQFASSFALLCFGGVVCAVFGAPLKSIDFP
jgi:hypothetical protein